MARTRDCGADGRSPRRRRRRAEGRSRRRAGARAAGHDPRLAELLAGRLASLLRGPARHRDRAVGRRPLYRSASPADERLAERHLGQSVRVAGGQQRRPVPLPDVGARGAAVAAAAAGRPERAGARRRVGPGPDLSGPAERSPRRGAVRVPLHEPDRDGRPGHRIAGPPSARRDCMRAFPARRTAGTCSSSASSGRFRGSTRRAGSLTPSRSGRGTATR